MDIRFCAMLQKQLDHVPIATPAAGNDQSRRILDSRGAGKMSRTIPACIDSRAVGEQGLDRWSVSQRGIPDQPGGAVFDSGVIASVVYPCIGVSSLCQKRAEPRKIRRA